MVFSMTGFGRAQQQSDNCRITVEIRSVNHRYLDLSVKMPKRFGALEAKVRSVLKDYVKRGKVDVYVTAEDLAGSDTSLLYNADLARQYVAYAECMKEDFGIEGDLSVSDLMRCPDVLTTRAEEMDEEATWSLLSQTVRQAAAAHAEARSQEGEALASDIRKKLQELKREVDLVISRAPEMLAEYKERLREKTADLLASGQIDENRIAAEVVLYADRVCTDEETVRLIRHIDSMSEVLDAGEEIGRKLDFIAQEMNREANTLLSKSNDLQTSEVGIEIKTGIEKIREQIQNIE